jgi:hypothetical protein
MPGFHGLAGFFLAPPPPPAARRLLGERCPVLRGVQDFALTSPRGDYFDLHNFRNRYWSGTHSSGRRRSNACAIVARWSRVPDEHAFSDHARMTQPGKGASEAA